MIVEKLEKGAKDTIFIYTTCRDREEARSIGLSAIEKKLAVCADFWEINSIYPWHNVIQDVEQYMLILTTEGEMGAELIKFIGTIHSYSTPMIARLDTNMMNVDYKFWVEDTLHGKGEYMSESEAKLKKAYDDEDGYHFGKLK